MAITQLSVFLMNQPGALMDAVGDIAGAGANIRAMSIAEANDFGILRIIVSDTDAVSGVLGEKYLVPGPRSWPPGWTTAAAPCIPFWTP